MIQKIDHETAYNLIKEENAVLIDVREEEEFALKHADGAVLIPVDSIDEFSAGLVLNDYETPVIVYCRSGNRSALAASRLSSLGYKRVYDAGSMVGWPYGYGYGTL